MRPFWLASVLCFASFSLCWAADAGTSSANFLRLGAGPRAIAMGEAQVGLADDAYATYWNPAGLSRLTSPEAAFAYNQYLESIRQQYAAYAHPIPGIGTLAGSLNYLGVGKFQGYDASGQPTGSVGASDLALGASYGRTLWRDRRMGGELAAGITAKYIRESLDSVSASATAFDLGLFARPGKRWGDWMDGWGAGLAIKNLGSSMKFDQDSFPLPRSYTGGISYTGRLWKEDITAALDGTQPRDGSRYYGAGIEVWTLQTLVLRGGYTTQGDLGSGLRAGAGIRFKTLQVDYAWSTSGDFGSTHRIGITFRFNRPYEDPLYQAQLWYERGMREYKRGKYPEALVAFNKALELDPTHTQALDMMKKTYEKIKILTIP